MNSRSAVSSFAMTGSMRLRSALLVYRKSKYRFGD